MSAHRPGHAGCHCCTDEAATVPAEFHRDLVTGAVPDAPNELLDAREELWRCDDGDIDGLTQEQVFLNCSGTMSVETSTANSLDATPGSLRFRNSKKSFEQAGCWRWVTDKQTRTCLNRGLDALLKLTSRVQGETEGRTAKRSDTRVRKAGDSSLFSGIFNRHRSRTHFRFRSPGCRLSL